MKTSMFMMRKSGTRYVTILPFNVEKAVLLFSHILQSAVSILWRGSCGAAAVRFAAVSCVGFLA
jgi:hypothetical protein